MNQQGITKPIGIGIIALIVVLAGGVFGYQYFKDTASTTNDSVACAQDAKLCSDGSYVGRTGPDCEFVACPDDTNTNSQNNTNTGTSANVNQQINTNTTTVNANTSTATIQEYPFAELLDDYMLNSLRVGTFVTTDAVIVGFRSDAILVGATPASTETVPILTENANSNSYSQGQGYVITFKVASPTGDPELVTAGQPSDGYNQ